jgi:integrase
VRAPTRARWPPGPLRCMVAPEQDGSSDAPRERRPQDPKEVRPVTFAQLFEEFLDFSRARGRSPTTLHSYATAISGFWLPRIGDQEISSLGPHTLDVIYAEALTREKPASPSTVRRYHAILSAALNQAVKWQWLVSNPARLATLPYPRHPEPNAPSPEQVRALVAACASASEILGMFVLVAAVTGCRRGELAALQWGDYADRSLRIRGSAFRLGRLHGVKETKTGRGRRVAVDDDLDAVLRRWRHRCELRASDAGTSLDADSLMFSPDPAGRTPININTVTSSFRRVATGLGLPSVHFHSLRHFAATQLISSGVDPRTAASRLGHANPTMTLRVYAHSTSESEQRAAEIGAKVVLGSPARSDLDAGST